MAYETQTPYALRQFEIDVLVPLKVFGLDVSFTTSAQAMITTLVVTVAWMLFAARRRLIVPDRMQTSVEMLYTFVAGTVTRIAGPEAKPAIPFVMTVFLLIFFGSLIGLTPIKFTFTSHLVVTLALALAVFVYVNVLAFSIHGLGFFRFFLPDGIPLYAAPIVVIVEVVSYLFRPVTLGVRIFANILAGHIMLKLFGDFCGMLVDGLGPLGLPLTIVPVAMMVVIYAFEAVIFFIQAYIFMVITSFYLRDAIHAH